MSTQPYVVVVGTDYSKPSERAFRAAYDQARRHAPAELHVLHVSLAQSEALLSPPPFAGFGGATLPSIEEQQARLVAYLDKLIVELPDFRTAKVQVIAHVLLDVPELGVIRLAADLGASLIVVGTHGRHGIARWLLGSVAEAVVRQAGCPVLVVPPEPTSLQVPQIEPPCPACVEARRASGSKELWCTTHREHHGRRHTYFQTDRVGADTNFPLVVR
jgi:nucleotide-binding universal stress UspA family protein